MIDHVTVKGHRPDLNSVQISLLDKQGKSLGLLEAALWQGRYTDQGTRDLNRAKNRFNHQAVFSVLSVSIDRSDVPEPWLGYSNVCPGSKDGLGIAPCCSGTQLLYCLRRHVRHGPEGLEKQAA